MQVYDEADSELLILGEPGAGKTTLLLELASVLLDRAEADERQHIPVVLNLSSWAQKRLPLSGWLVEELWTKYQTPRRIGQAWIDTDQVLTLLDGLDEVAESPVSLASKPLTSTSRIVSKKGHFHWSSAAGARNTWLYQPVSTCIGL